MAVTIRGNSNLVLQVVTASTTTGVTFGYGSYTNVGLTATITPTSTTSKILIMISGSVYGATNQYANATLYRNGSDLTVLGSGLRNAYLQNGGAWYQDIGFNYIDSPASTSALTYTLYCKNGNNTGSMEYLPGPSYGQIILMEIAS